GHVRWDAAGAGPEVGWFLWKRNGAAAGQSKPGAAKPAILPAGGACRGRRGHVAAGGQELVRVLGHAFDQHLEMQVRPGGPPGGADRRDLLATLDDVALLHEHLRCMRVAGDEVV